MTQTPTNKKPIVISTTRDLADNGMTLGLYCLNCDRWSEVIPQEWFNAGKPNADYVAKTFKCKDCGETASKQVRPNLYRMGLPTVTC